MSETAQLTRVNLAGMQACVPEGWTDEQAEAFANREHPTGIASRWTVRKDGHPDLGGDSERVPCDERNGFVHVTFAC